MRRVGLALAVALALVLVATSAAADAGSAASADRPAATARVARTEPGPRLETGVRWTAERAFLRLAGPVGLGRYVVAPGQEPGPYLGPPHRLFEPGFGASAWRDPVTGRPLY